MSETRAVPEAPDGPPGRAPVAERGPAEASTVSATRRYAPLLDVIRVVAVIGVVVVHVIADHVGPEAPAGMLVLRSVLATAVPAFVMISGALNLAPAAMRHGSGPFLARRLRRLLPATVMWTAFYVLVMNVSLSPEPTDWSHEVGDLLTASSYPHLYFLPLIVGLTVISPVLATYVAGSSRRAWISGGLAAAWALGVAAMPYVTEGLLEEAVVPLQLGALTYFLPYIGYYLLGRATWTAPPGRTVSWWLLLAAVPLLVIATVWAYASPVTEIPPGKALLPTYLAPTVMPLALALVISVLSLGREWRVSAGVERWLRKAGDATFGVFLIHFAILVLLRDIGFAEDSALSVLALISVVTLASFVLTWLGKKVPGLRAVL